MVVADKADHDTLQLRLLGSFRALAGSANHNVTPRGRKARALLAYVALNESGRITRERAAALLWSDRGAEQARVSLRQCLAEIRAASPDLANAVTIDREHISVDLSRVRTDIGLIAAAEPTGDVESLTHLLEACDGAFLDDLYGLSPGFDDWLLVERPRRHDVLLTTALQTARAAFVDQNFAGLRGLLAALERIDPGNEQVAQLGMELDGHVGDTASLHRRYRRLVDVLKRELDAKPSERTRQMFYDLTQLSHGNDAPPGPSAPATSPADTVDQAVPVVIISPLTAIDQAPETHQLAAICTGDISTALARHRDLRVIPIDQPDLERIERVCGGSRSSYVLSGTVRSTEGVWRCNVQLNFAVTGVVLWSEQVIVSDATLEGAVDRIVGRTVGAVAPVVERYLTERTAADLPSEQSVILYSRARRQLYQARDLAALRQVADKLERVVASGPGHANARLLLAQLYNTDFFQRIAGHDPQAYRARAFELALHAAALDPDNGVTQLRLAWCFLRREQWDAAIRHFDRAADLSRFDSLVLNEAGFGFCHLGDVDRSEYLIRRAFELNPFPPTDFHADLAVLLALTGRSRAAEEQFEASADTTLHYLAARLANLELSERPHPEMAQQLRERFAQAWIGKVPFDDDRLVDWMLIYLPLRDATARAWLREGLTRALARAG